MPPVRALAVTAAFILTACGQEEVRVSHRTPIALSDDAVAPGAAPASPAAKAAKPVAAKPQSLPGATPPGSPNAPDTPAPPADPAADDPVVADAPAPTIPETAPTTTMPKVPPPATLGSGLYFAKEDPSGKLQLQHESEPLAGLALLPKEGFSLAETAIVTFEAGADVYDNRLVVASPDGKMRRVIALPNTYQPRHPTLSPDGTQVAFDAHAVSAAKVIAQSSSVYVTDLDAQTTKVASQGGDAVAPVWFPVTRRLLYASGRTDGGRDLVIVDPNDSQTFITTSMGGDSAHVAISADEGEIFVPATGQTFSARFAPKSTLAAAISRGATAAGQAGFATVSATYAPAGGSIVLAGLVKNQVVIAEVDRMGGGFKVLSGPFAMTLQTAAGGKYLPVFLTDFP